MKNIANKICGLYIPKKLVGLLSPAAIPLEMSSVS